MRLMRIGDFTVDAGIVRGLIIEGTKEELMELPNLLYKEVVIAPLKPEEKPPSTEAAPQPQPPQPSQLSCYPDWAQRLILERYELAGRIIKLEKFLNSSPVGIPSDDMALLRRQYNIMQRYVEILDSRIRKFEPMFIPPPTGH